MARNLAESSDLPLFVFNRTVSKAEELAKEITLLGTKSSIVIAQTIGELVNACDVIFTNLANDGVVQSIYAQINDILEVRSSMPSLVIGL
jgi:3-hydroxyisobutyrate dehydrogenase-like beta-hydroxyacid dehydrogenase